MKLRLGAAVLAIFVFGSVVWAGAISIESGGYQFLPALKLTGNQVPTLSITNTPAGNDAIEIPTSAIISLNGSLGTTYFRYDGTNILVGTVSGTVQLVNAGQYTSTSTSSPQFHCSGAGVCTVSAANAQNLNLVTSGGGVVQANGTAVSTSADWTLTAYDNVTVVGTTGNIYQVGPTTNASTLRDITFVATPIAGGGTGTETIKLATVSGCGSGVLGTLSIACNGAAGAITTGTVNASAVAATSTLFVCITGACSTADIQGNVSAHFTTP